MNTSYLRCAVIDKIDLTSARRPVANGKRMYVRRIQLLNTRPLPVVLWSDLKVEISRNNKNEQPASIRTSCEEVFMGIS